MRVQPPQFLGVAWLRSGRGRAGVPQTGHLLHERRDVRQLVVAENEGAQVLHVADGFRQARDFVPLQPQRVELLHPEEVTGVPELSQSHVI